jgi:hypothetical protein
MLQNDTALQTALQNRTVLQNGTLQNGTLQKAVIPT